MDFINYNRPRWIFFDLDDTLWDFEGNSVRSLRHVYGNFKIISDRFRSFEAFSDEYHIHNSRMWKEYAEGKITSGFIRTERWRLTLFPEKSQEETESICREINDEYLWKLAEFPFVVEGAKELLADLAKKHLLAVISNGFTDTQYRKLENSGLSRYITRVIISDEIGIQKPDTRLFEHAIRETGASGEYIMIGDNPSTDISGAMAAGWKAIWFNPSEKEFPFSKEELAEKGIDHSLLIGSARTLAEVGTLLAESHSVK